MKDATVSRRGSLLFHVFLLLVVVAMIASSLTFSERARLLPLMIGVPTGFLILLSLVRELKPDLVIRFQNAIGIVRSPGTGGEAVAGGSAIVDQEVPPLKSFVIGGGWFCFLLLVVLFFGFLFASLVFVPCFLLLFARYSKWRVFLYTAVLFLIEWYGFESLLGLKLWHGAGPEIIPGFVGGGVLPPFF